MPPAVEDTRGRHALLALLDAKSQKELSEELEVSQPTLSQIARRQRLPGREIAAKFEKAGIKFGWWDLEPTKAQLAREAQRRSEESAA